MEKENNNKEKNEDKKMENKFALFSIIDCNIFYSSSCGTEFVKALVEV